MSRTTFALTLVLPLLFAGPLACGDDEDDGVQPTGPFDLTFAGDATFQGPHGGQEIHVILFDGTGEIAAQSSGTVSADDDPAFAFTFVDALQEGEDYVIRYWIDSNFGESTRPGACDETSIDHQWEVTVGNVTDDVDITEPHDAGALTPVCDFFAFDLDFSGDATFQGPHGGQDITVGLVRTTPGDEILVTTRSGTVSADDDPAFSFSFPGALVHEFEYHLDYWIDSNFAGGTEGECDPMEVDHQWRLEIDAVDDDVAIEDDHRADALEPVCSTFE